MSLSCPESLFPLTVTQVSTYLKRYIEKGFSFVYVQGEISGCKRHGSGHIYFSLKDEQAVLEAICWRGTKLSLDLQEGALVTCKGRITTYGMRSKYQLIVESAELAGQGALLQKIQELKNKLTQEGLFQLDRKKPLPAFPNCIGLITSPTGAVIQDMLIRFETRFPCSLILYPVAVQGQRTVPDVLAAFDYFHQHHPRPDLLILARGGGSIEDLHSFNEEALVRRVALSEIPVISAIGHETDTTLVDYAADARAPTPTAAAEMALPLVSTLQEALAQQGLIFVRHLKHHLALCALALHGVGLPSFFQYTFPLEQQLDEAKDALDIKLTRLITQKMHQWELSYQNLKKWPGKDWQRAECQLETWGQDLRKKVEAFLCAQEALWASYGRLLHQLSYHRTLERGFALVFDPSHNLCLSRAQGEDHPHLTLRFHDGLLPVQVHSHEY